MVHELSGLEIQGMGAVLLRALLARPERSWAGQEGCFFFNSFQEERHKSSRR